MGISRREAFETLELPFGADQDSARTSFKRLAMKWHPEKHKNSPESIKNFLEISMAYRRLNIECDIVQMSVSDCLDQYKNTFNMSSCQPAYSNGYSVSDDDDSDDDDDDDDDLDYYLNGKYNVGGFRLKDGVVSKSLSPQEVEKNANELITEDEKEKRRSEKRRAKKKRRREKKRQEKQADQSKKEEDTKKKSTKKEPVAEPKVKKQVKKVHGSSGSEAEEFDRSAAFFTQVVNKKKKPGNVPDPASNTKPRPELSKTTNGNDESLEDLDPVVLRSRQLAIEGNKMANYGHYQAAIDLFTEAVKLDPRDFRFFGNRSYCFDRMQQYEKALKDAEKAISLAPDWPKGYFRKGRALAGLKLFAEAEQAFMQVLKLDRNCEDAMQELLRVRTYQLTEMGFSQQQAQSAIRRYDSVQQALDSLLAGVAESSLGVGEVYMSDDEDYGGGGATSAPQAVSLHAPLVSNHSHGTLSKPKDVKKMDPCNPEGLTALWVGNVLPEVTEKRLLTMFSKFGQVTSVRLLPEKYCAFINFKSKEAAGVAMKGLQGAPCAGQQLLIKFPDNPLVNGNSTANNVVIRKTPAAPVAAAATTKQNSKPVVSQTKSSQSKVSGPVNGDECYFWRTTGCQFGKECHYRHQTEHRGIDRKPWQKD